MKKIYFPVRILIIYLFFITSGLAAKSNYFDKGKILFDKQKFEKSKIFFEKDIVFNPQSEKSYLYLAKIFNENNNDHEQEINLSNVLLLNPQNEEAIYMLTLLKIRQSNYKEAKELIRKFKPQIVYTTPYNDLNKDHQKVYESTLVATRPLKNTVKQVLSYENPGFTKNPFQPSVYENITKEFSTKIKAFECYKSEIENFPHPRSIKSLESIAMYRGVEAGFQKAEAFKLVRSLIE